MGILRFSHLGDFEAPEVQIVWRAERIEAPLWYDTDPEAHHKMWALLDRIRNEGFELVAEWDGLEVWVRQLGEGVAEMAAIGRGWAEHGIVFWPPRGDNAISILRGGEPR